MNKILLFNVFYTETYSYSDKKETKYLIFIKGLSILSFDEIFMHETLALFF